MPKKYVARLANEQCRQLETSTLRPGGKIEEAALDTQLLRNYMGEPYGTRVRNLLGRLGS